MRWSFSGRKMRPSSSGRARCRPPGTRFGSRSACIPIRPASSPSIRRRRSNDRRAAIAAQPLGRAVGEIGLDYHYDFSPRDVQQQVFREQIQLAPELKLPIVIHTREAEDDTFGSFVESGLERSAACSTVSPAIARWRNDVSTSVSTCRSPASSRFRGRSS